MKSKFLQRWTSSSSQSRAGHCLRGGLCEPDTPQSGAPATVTVDAAASGLTLNGSASEASETVPITLETVEQFLDPRPEVVPAGIASEAQTADRRFPLNVSCKNLAGEEEQLADVYSRDSVGDIRQACAEIFGIPQDPRRLQLTFEHKLLYNDDISLKVALGLSEQELQNRAEIQKETFSFVCIIGKGQEEFDAEVRLVGKSLSPWLAKVLASSNKKQGWSYALAPAQLNFGNESDSDNFICKSLTITNNGKATGEIREHQQEIEMMKNLALGNNPPGSIMQIHSVYMWTTDTTKETRAIMPATFGGTLNQYKQAFPIPEAIAIPFFRQMLEAVKYIHDLGIVHRSLDFTSFVFMDKSQSQLVLTNLGLATIIPEGSGGQLRLNPAATAVFGARGLAFTNRIAPEVREKKGVNETPVYYNTSVDMWSLGVVFYEILLGKKTFYLGCEKTLRNSEDIKDIISEPVRNLIIAMLEKNPNARATPTTALTLVKAAEHGNSNK